MRPIIGISSRTIVDDPRNPPLLGVRRGYVDAILDAGGVPLLIPPGIDGDMLRNMYPMFDGVLLSGGADIDPRLYGEDAHPRLGMLEPDRDTTEFPLARWAVADGKPLFAICRGMQVLNVALGGTLYQDLGSQHPSAIEHDIGSIEHDWNRQDHLMQVAPTSRLATMLGTTEAGVNSLHHQALRTIAPQVEVVAQAPDGIVEAIEGTNEAWVVGVQCHPEQLWNGADQRWRNVFRAFVDAAGAYHTRHVESDVSRSVR